MDIIRRALYTLLFLVSFSATAVSDFHSPCEKSLRDSTLAMEDLKKCLEENVFKSGNLSSICLLRYEEFVKKFQLAKVCEQKVSF